VRNARAPAPASHFLGVRLTAEEVALLDEFRSTNDLPNRSEAVRSLVRGAGGAPAPTFELPVSLLDDLEGLVEDGYARDLTDAITSVVQAGLGELARTHTERLPAWHERARSKAERRRDRTGADREGRGLLRR
jgi:Arc/MetJ-type ribon-helix-helix transcriptional regulator